MLMEEFARIRYGIRYFRRRTIDVQRIFTNGTLHPQSRPEVLLR